MTDSRSLDRRSFLDLPPVEREQYDRNLIRQAVCEVRFPTIFEFATDRPPAKFWSALKRDYPYVGSFQDIAVDGTNLSAAPGHQLADKQLRWKIVLRPSTLTLETDYYVSFDEFRARFLRLLDLARPVLDTSFFTRVGLRYINTVPWDISTVRDWVRPELGSLLSQPLGELSEYLTRVVGATEFGGGYIIQSGIVQNNKTNTKEFSIDFDLFKENVGYDEAFDLIDTLHDWESRLFKWSLGPAAMEYLSAPKHTRE